MIEVEKKFILTKQQEENLIKDAEFLGQKDITDLAYDTPNYSLTSKDIWLRNRNGKFELKLPLNNSIETRVLDQYRELENDEEILTYFGADIHENLADFLAKKGYVPFCKIHTARKKYKKEGFTIDLDTMDFGYTLAEIEYMVEDESHMKEAADLIIAFAQKHNINTDTMVRGKLVEYLRRNDQKHFQVLVDAKVVT